MARLHVGLDNLVAARAIVPPVVAFVRNAPSSQIVRTRIAETACNPAFAAMLADELLPMLRARYPVSADPDRVVLAGDSYTGLAAAHAALERPDAFGVGDVHLGHPRLGLREPPCRPARARQGR
ncbi:alpha/beta hydrolase [Sorangium cellulosum]|uniref:alpha/beta hydrolase n=1 Tax=Sorangium cellulosum TaxID=56 RepID=UPI001F5D61A3|nr:alpha/beta hydrolase-fold protein [Sorangium cellulosum]